MVRCRVKLQECLTVIARPLQISASAQKGRLLMSNGTTKQKEHIQSQSSFLWGTSQGRCSVTFFTGEKKLYLKLAQGYPERRRQLGNKKGHPSGEIPVSQKMRIQK